MPTARRIGLLLLPLLALACASDEYVELYPYTARVPMRYDPPQLLDRALSVVPPRGDERPRRLSQMFAEAGCISDSRDPESTVQEPGSYRYDDGSIPVRDTRLPNIVCRLPGESKQTILVAAHHTRPGRRGIPGEWTGAAMLPSLYRSLSVAKRKHTYLFVGLADPIEYGMGMASLLRALGTERNDIAALVMLEIIGLGPLAAWKEQSDPELWVDLFSTGEALGIPVRSSSLGARTHVDGRALRGFKVASIVLYSFEEESEKIAKRSQAARGLDVIDRETYYASYRLIASFLGYLDDTLDVRRRYLGGELGQR